MSKLTDYFEALLMGDNQMPKYPTDTDIRHLTLNSCHGCNVPDGKVPPEVMEAYRPLLLDNRMMSRKERKRFKLGGRHPLPGSAGELSILATSDPECGGNELSFSVYTVSPKPSILMLGRYYNASDRIAPFKWEQLVWTFSDYFQEGMASAWPGFDHELLLDPPPPPWLGVILMKPFDLLQFRIPDLGLYLSSAEQAIAVTWRAICNERKAKAV